MNDKIKAVMQSAKSACGYIGSRNTQDKNAMLKTIADALVKNAKPIIKANKTDIKNATDKPSYFIDRLMVDENRIKGAAEGLIKLIDLPDPIGEVVEVFNRPNGMRVEKCRVPLGVIAIIYEARPLVTVDAIGLCLKTGNSVLLRGSKDAIETNREIVKIIKAALVKNKYQSDCVGFIDDTSRDSANYLMQAREYVDVLIPRGSAALIKAAVEGASVPVIETGAGNCHAYVEATADLGIAEKVILNGKLSRPSVCNSLESLLVDNSIAKQFLPRIVQVLASNGVEVVGCGKTKAICPQISLATNDDFYTEFLALKISIKVVDGVTEAISHINKYGTKHSEVILSKDKSAIDKFLQLVDSAAVYANCSTRFTDGFEFGFGAEMGISTQKLHARGPMGLRELTSCKYKIYGDGQVR